uniref:Tyrosyl-DNA phosphodiesterase 2 n=1 Tax=Capra hircus TaxID=9925 RepID=A0A452DKQ8_CAPHI
MERSSGPEAGPEAELEEGEPEVKKRKLLCVEFASVASCDAAVAQCYLAENDWEMERALNSYFEPAVEESASESRPEYPSEPKSCVDLTKEGTNDSISSKTSASEGKNVQQEDGSVFSFITWNIDGLDMNNLYSPDVIFLQEVIPPYYAYLKKKASSYKIITGHEEGYFTAIMLKKSRVKFKSQEIIPFPNTQMMRNLLCVHLKMVLEKMQEAPGSATVIFAGDTNLRDQEVTKCGGLPNNILDVWEFWGKPKHCHATCKLRFDRIFFRAAAEGGHIIPQSLDLLGLEKLDCG